MLKFERDMNKYSYSHKQVKLTLTLKTFLCDLFEYSMKTKCNAEFKLPCNILYGNTVETTVISF